ncbi:MAG: hypothetical protein JSV19_08585 [Phycisphaerales bacterium]|nr:MAG: hypothetical protein JSV19_08585 [Phycisphaerales bacterium]
MAKRPSKPPRWTAAGSGARWLWGAVAAIHGPALVTSFESFIGSGLDPSRAGGFVALALSMLFFLAKIWGVKALEFGTNRRAVLTVAIALVLIHGNAIEACLQFGTVPKAVPVGATTLLAAGLAGVQGRLDAMFSAADRERSRRRWRTPAIAAGWARSPARCHAALTACLCTPRAPPV